MNTNKINYIDNLINVDNFINKNIVSILIFTNDNFEIFNKQLRNVSNICDESNFLFINSNKSVNIINKMNIKSIPIIYIYKNSKLIEEVFGTYNNVSDIIRLHF